MGAALTLCLKDITFHKSLTFITLFQPSFAFHIETSHLICCANQMNGFYMKCNTTASPLIICQLLPGKGFVWVTMGS